MNFSSESVVLPLPILRIKRLYFRFEKHENNDTLAQVARLIDNLDGNHSALVWRLTGGRERFSPEDIKDSRAKQEVMAFASIYISNYVDFGFEAEVLGAFRQLEVDMSFSDGTLQMQYPAAAAAD